MKLVIASKNPVKVSAVEHAFNHHFPSIPLELNPVSVSSGVSDQPLSDSETLTGALNRANNAKKLRPDADFWIGIEAGMEPYEVSMEQDESGMNCFAWCVILSNDTIGRARTATFQLPPEMIRLIKTGKELGDVHDILFNKKNSKQQGGVVGLLTHNAITRTDYYRHALHLAIIPFINEPLFRPD